MRILRTTLAERVLFWALILGALAFFVTGIGCAEARRTYTYDVTHHPDGSVTKSVSVDIVNSDVKVGQLEATGADGTSVKLTDLTAEERASQANVAAWETMGKVIDKIPAADVR